ncbi:hypothetical protein B0H11DRAFT_2303465 [Mycena galericulata]|nr:hypothetical protein B0H11DRAFT_2303465 [Mycena galericulata]
MAEHEPKISSQDSTTTLHPGTPTNAKSSWGSSPSATEAPPRSFLSSLPEWVSGPLLSRRAWKVLLRCWVASLVSFIILLPDASLRTIGVTSFFALLTSLLLPPYLPVQLTLFIISTLVVGLLSGWGIGIGAMRAANAVRDQAIIQAAGVQIEASINASAIFQGDPTLAEATAVFSGWFLDVRATAMYGAFLAVGTFIFGLMRAYAPKLIFMSIFGTIGLDVFCAIGPLFPTKRYTLLNSMGISVGCYMAIVVITTLLIFPETMSHAALSTVAAQLERIAALIRMQDGVFLGAERVQERERMPTKFKALRTKVIATQQQLTATSGFLSLEFSYGRWSGDDVRSLEAPTVALIARVGCLLNFDRLVGTARLPPSASTESVNAVHTNDTYLLRQIHTRNAAREAAHGVRPADVLPTLDAVTTELRLASIALLGAVHTEVDRTNTTRWRRNPVQDAACAADLDAASTRLHAALAGFKTAGQSALLAPYLPLFQEMAAAGAEPGAEAEAEDPPLRALFVAYVFAAEVLGIAEAVLVLADAVRGISAKRVKAQVWAPTGLRPLWKLVTARGDKTDGAFGEDTAPPVQPVAREGDYHRDPDSRPPTNVLQKAMHGIHRAYQWSGSAEAVFTFKYVLVSIALWLPAVFKHSAHFYYVEKGIWALIMAQTTLNIYASDQIFNYVTRLLGTLAGLALGLVAWYAGNGRGNGNPYGAAVAVGVCIIPLLFIRIFAPERYLAGNVLCCTTFALVVGYSWIDGHAYQFASPGIGWSVAWKRWALVVSGSAASFVLMMFPPKSGRKAVRQRNAASIASLGETYAFLISTWITTPEDKAAPTWTLDFQARLMALADEMHAIRDLTELAKWEGSIRGKWPAKEYARLVDVQVDMIGSLAQLGGSLAYLQTEWRQTFVHSSKILNPNFISDVMAVFSLISQALRTGEPLHQVLPQNLLDRLFYHHSHTQALTPSLGTAKRIDVEALKSPTYMQYATGMIAVYQLLASVDEMHEITRELCGEIPLTGFASWRAEYDRGHNAV